MSKRYGLEACWLAARAAARGADEGEREGWCERCKGKDRLIAADNGRGVVMRLCPECRANPLAAASPVPVDELLSNCCGEGVHLVCENCGRPAPSTHPIASPVPEAAAPVSDVKEGRVGILRPDLLEDDPAPVSDAKVTLDASTIFDVLDASFDRPIPHGELMRAARNVVAAVSGEDEDA